MYDEGEGPGKGRCKEAGEALKGKGFWSGFFLVVTQRSLTTCAPLRSPLCSRITHALPPVTPSPFSNFNLRIPAGKTVALVGESGSGKSTIVGLVERFYDVLEGCVLLDGVDIRQYRLSWLRQQVSDSSTISSCCCTVFYAPGGRCKGGGNPMPQALNLTPPPLPCLLPQLDWHCQPGAASVLHQHPRQHPLRQA